MSNLFAPNDGRRAAAIAELRAMARAFRNKQVESLESSLTMSTSLGWCATRVEERIEELEQGAALRI